MYFDVLSSDISSSSRNWRALDELVIKITAIPQGYCQEKKRVQAASKYGTAREEQDYDYQGRHTL